MKMLSSLWKIKDPVLVLTKGSQNSSDFITKILKPVLNKKYDYIITLYNIIEINSYWYQVLNALAWLNYKTWLASQSLLLLLLLFYYYYSG